MTEIPMSSGMHPDAQSSSATVPPARTPPPRDTITPAIIEALAKTKPWVRFLSIVGYLIAGLMILIGLGVAGVGVFQAMKSPMEGGILAGMGVMYLAIGILYVFPSRYLGRYAKSIGAAMTAQSKAWPVQQALEHQKSFWKFAGIMTLITVLLYIPGILLAIAVPNFLTAMQRSKQKRTMADMRTIATALEARASDVNAYPPPMDMNELAKLLEPKYVQKLPRVDGWSTPIRYEASCPTPEACDSYLLMSAGKNGAFEQQLDALPSERQATTKFDEDIVMIDGQWLIAPEGTPD